MILPFGRVPFLNMLQACDILGYSIRCHFPNQMPVERFSFCRRFLDCNPFQLIFPHPCLLLVERCFHQFPVFLFCHYDPSPGCHILFICADFRIFYRLFRASGNPFLHLLWGFLFHSLYLWSSSVLFPIITNIDLMHVAVVFGTPDIFYRCFVQAPI